MAYDINAIKAKLAKANSSSTKESSNKDKTKYFKAAIGEYDIRFLPYEDRDGQPFETVGFYNKLIKFGEPRVVSPGTFGQPDPIKAVFDVLRKKKENWNVAKNLQPQDRIYAVIIDRAKESEGPLVWEFSPDVRDKIFGILTSKFNIKKQMFDETVGYDFGLTVTQKKDSGGKPQFYNGNPVKNFEFQPFPEQSPLHKDPKQVKEWLTAMPKLGEMFKNMLMTGEQLEEKCNAFIANLTATTTGPTVEGTNATNDRGVTQSMTDKAVSNKIDDAFKDLDDGPAF